MKKRKFMHMDFSFGKYYDFWIKIKGFYLVSS